jgi:hypothetical protein
MNRLAQGWLVSRVALALGCAAVAVAAAGCGGGDGAGDDGALGEVADAGDGEVASDAGDADAGDADAGDARDADAALPDADVLHELDEGSELGSDADADAETGDDSDDADTARDVEVDAGPPPCLVDEDCPGSACAAAVCDLASGGCSTEPLTDGAACDDNNACSLGDSCQGGACIGSQSQVCADDNPCTDDLCKPATGCSFKNNFATCDDGDPCTTKDVCAAGVCLAGGAACDDSNPCTADSCEAATGNCTNTPSDAALCSDGSECTFGDHCAGGKCVSGALDGCDDGNQCTADSCLDEKTCQQQPLTNTDCADDDLCTTPDVCKAGVCQAGPKVDCNDDNPCTSEFCDPVAGCQYTDITAGPCDDKDKCTLPGTCGRGGQCVSSGALDCDDKNPCTKDSCQPDVGCVFASIGGPCSDGNACTEGDACDKDACVGTETDCDDGNACTKDSCDTTLGCQHVDISSGCDDGNACTNDSCDKGLGCVHTPNSAPCALDPDPCSTGAKCALGVCAKIPLDCDDHDPCTLDVCDPEELCVHQPFSGPCDDGDACTAGEVCTAGASCAGGAPVEIDDGIACTVDSCDPVDGVAHEVDSSLCPLGSACFPEGDCTAIAPQLLITRLALVPDPPQTGAGQGSWLAITNIGIAAVDLATFRLDSAVSSIADIFPVSGDPTAPLPIQPGQTLAGIKTPPAGTPVPPGFGFTFGKAADLFAFGIFGDQATILTPSLKVNDFMGFQTFAEGPEIIFGSMPLIPGAVVHLDAARLATAQEGAANDNLNDWCIAQPGAGSAPDAPQVNCALALLSEIQLGGDDGDRWIELFVPPGGPLTGLVVRIFDAAGVGLASFPLESARAPFGERFVLADTDGGVQLPRVTDGSVQLFRGAVLIDVYGFGALTATTDASGGFPLFAKAPGPSQISGDAAVRIPEEANSKDNTVDWVSDPTGSPGLPNF